MHFRNRHPRAQIPEVNLVPMMDVLMTVLTFFIIISMSLTGQQLLTVTLPGISASTENNKPEQQTQLNAFVVGLNQNGEILQGNEPVSFAQLTQKMQDYLTQNPTGEIVLKADRQLNYEKIAQFLEKLGQIGGDRVSLAVEKN